MESGSMTFDDTATPGKKRDYNNFETSFKKMEDSQKISKLEAKLDAITKVGEWRLEQLKLMDAEKRAAEKTLEEERKLFAEMSLDHIRQNTAQIQALQENFMTLLNNRIANGNILGLQQLSMASALSQAATSKQERALDGMREQLKLRSDERDKWKTKCKKLEEEAVVAQQQMKKLTMEFGRCKTESAKMANAKSEGNNLSEEVCRDLLEQLEQRNIELQRCKAESSKGPLVELKRQILKRDEEIQRLKRIVDDHNVRKTEVTECIVCMDEFGVEPDRQRAHWQDCNHANVCYKCSVTLWNSNKRKCPSCNTPASTMPGRLPPNIYL